MVRWSSATKCMILFAFGVSLLTFSLNQQVSAASKSAPVVKVRPTQITDRGGVTCGYVKTGKQKKSKWQSGTKVSAKKFRAHSDEVRFLTQSLAADNKTSKKAKAANDLVQVRKLEKRISDTRIKLAEIRRKASLGQASCSELTSIRYDTKDVVALAIVEPSTGKGSTSKKSVSAAKINTRPGLVGIVANGKVKNVVESIDNNSQTLSENLSILRTYEAPDGSVIIQYITHPEKCLLSKISVLGGPEECQVFEKDLGSWDGISKVGGYFGDEALDVQFDELGGMYFLASKGDKDCVAVGSTDGGYTAVNTIFSLRDGLLKEMPIAKCAKLMTWSAMSTGGVLYNAFPWGPWTWSDWKVTKWDGTSSTILMEGVDVPANGLQSFPNGDSLISTSRYEIPTNPIERRNVQGATYRYRVNEGLDAWWHYADQNPQFSSELVAGQRCNCNALHPNIRNLIRIGSSLYGTGSIFDSQSPNSSAPESHHIFKLYPVVEIVAPIQGKLYDAPFASGTRQMHQTTDLLAKTDNWFVAAGPNYFSCLTSKIPGNCPASRHFLQAINVTTGASTELQTATNVIGVLSITSPKDGDVAYLQGVRISDGRYMIGTFNGSTATPTISWVETENLNYKYISILKR